MNNVIGENIRNLRKEKNFTQKQLAELLSTSQDTISLWELGKSYPNVLEIIMLTKFFNVSADYVLGLIEY